MNIRITNDAVEIDGYVNAVERLSRPLKDRLGEFMERIKAGAFKRALNRADDVRILLNHDHTKDLGGIKDGNLTLEEDAIGLHARACIKDPDVIKQARAGDLVGWSFGFTDRDGGVDMTEENGCKVRNVNDMNLLEVSLINRDKIPAYAGTLVSVRTADGVMNVSDITESEIKVTDETAQTEPEERADESTAETAETKEETVIDYSTYKEMINEMKGDN